jgi:large subunit ribosomal protein L23
MVKLQLNEIIRYPVTTESAVRLIESENKLAFIVDLRANKDGIQRAVEKLYQVKVDNVGTLIIRNQKKAFVKLKPEFKASDVAIKLGIL